MTIQERPPIDMAAASLQLVIQETANINAGRLSSNKDYSTDGMVEDLARVQAGDFAEVIDARPYSGRMIAANVSGLVVVEVLQCREYRLGQAIYTFSLDEDKQVDFQVRIPKTNPLAARLKTNVFSRDEGLGRACPSRVLSALINSLNL